MPKSTKKKKDKAADFTKAKLKLGKGKQTPSNAVDTSFKARSIALPTQNIVVDQATEVPSTKRRQTFDTLIAQTKHYNSGTRKDAVLGLRELLEAYPETIATHLTPLINSCVRLIGDEDAAVRRSLLALLTWLFRQIPRDNIIPHSPVLLLFTTSAQTHIFPEIRIDAVRFLDLFLEHIPEVVTEGWTRLGGTSHGRRVLEGYLGILNAGTTFGEGGDTGPVQATSTASVVLSPTSKLVVLKSLASFLSHAVTSAWHTKETDPSSSTTTTPTWYFSSSFSSNQAFESFDALLRPSTSTIPMSHRRWSESVGADDEDFVGQSTSYIGPRSAVWTLHDLVESTSGLQDHDTSSGIDFEMACVLHLAKTLQSTLVSTYLDSAPSVFSPSSSPPEIELQMVLVVCRIYRCLYGRILQNAAESGVTHESAGSDLQAMLTYLSTYFPFTVSGPSTMKRDIKTEQIFQDLNLIFCELSSFLVLADQHSDRRQPLVPKSSGHSKRHLRQADTTHPFAHHRQIERVREYIVQLLHGKGQPTNTPSSLPRPITPHAYIALLPTIWSLVSDHRAGVNSPSISVLSVVVDHAIKSSSTSVVKGHTIDFVGRLILLDREPEYSGAFRREVDQGTHAKLQEWVLQLPKTLWELGNTHLTTTETIMRLLLRLCQRRSRLLQPETLAALRSRLVPYFSITHPTRGKLPGPFAKLPVNAPARRLVLDLVATLSCQGVRVDEGRELETVVSEAVQDSPDSSYWTGILCSMRSWSVTIVKMLRTAT